MFSCSGTAIASSCKYIWLWCYCCLSALKCSSAVGHWCKSCRQVLSFPQRLICHITGHLESSRGRVKSEMEEAVKAARSAGVPVLTLPKHDLNILSDNRPHQVILKHTHTHTPSLRAHAHSRTTQIDMLRRPLHHLSHQILLVSETGGHNDCSA